MRHRDRGICIIHGAPVGTHLAIQYRSGSGGWKTAVGGRVGSRGRFHFVLHAATRATYTLTLLISASRVSAAARVAVGTLQIG